MLLSLALPKPILLLKSFIALFGSCCLASIMTSLEPSSDHKNDTITHDDISGTDSCVTGQVTKLTWSTADHKTTSVTPADVITRIITNHDVTNSLTINGIKSSRTSVGVVHSYSSDDVTNTKSSRDVTSIASSDVTKRSLYNDVTRRIRPKADVTRNASASYNVTRRRLGLTETTARITTVPLGVELPELKEEEEEVGKARAVSSRSRDARVPDEQRLYNALLGDYEPTIRPVRNASLSVLINFRLTLHQIVDLDERKQLLTTNVFINQEWEDQNLRWNASAFNGVKTLRVLASYVWLPDTFMLNNADEATTGYLQRIYVLLTSNGTVRWPVPLRLKSSCKVDITYFPFDDQICILRFGSWIYAAESVDFEGALTPVDLNYYIDNSEWDLLSIHLERTTRRHAGLGDHSPIYPDLHYVIHMRRRTFYYVFNIIVPCVMLSVLTLLTFWLPCTSGEKISLGLSVFLTFSMFMLLIAEEVPATSESVPLIGIYMITVMTMTSVSVIMAVMVISCYNRGDKARKPPRWLTRFVLNWLSTVVRLDHDVDLLADNYRLPEEDEQRYNCTVHEKRTLKSRPPTPRPSVRLHSRRRSSVNPSAPLIPSIAAAALQALADKQSTTFSPCRRRRMSEYVLDEHRTFYCPEAASGSGDNPTPLCLTGEYCEIAASEGGVVVCEDSGANDNSDVTCGETAVCWTFTTLEDKNDEDDRKVVNEVVHSCRKIPEQSIWRTQESKCIQRNGEVLSRLGKDSSVSNSNHTSSASKQVNSAELNFTNADRHISSTSIKRPNFYPRMRDEISFNVTSQTNDCEIKRMSRELFAIHDGHDDVTSNQPHLVSNGHDDVTVIHQSNASIVLADNDDDSVNGRCQGSRTTSELYDGLPSIVIQDDDDHDVSGSSDSKESRCSLFIDSSRDKTDSTFNIAEPIPSVDGAVQLRKRFLAAPLPVTSGSGGGARNGRRSVVDDSIRRCSLHMQLHGTGLVCSKARALANRKHVIVTWQVMATVVDRLLFWLFLLATLVAYIVILVIMPMTKKMSFR